MNLSLVEGESYVVNHYFPAQIVLEEGTYYVLYNGFKRPIISVSGSHTDPAAGMYVSRRVKVAITPSPLTSAAPA